MALKQYNPTSPGRRFMTTLTFTDLTKKEPERALTEPLKKSGGRNSLGRTTIWFRGGGHKRRYRTIDFRRDKRDVPAKVAALSTTPTARPGSRSCTTGTGRSATSWPLWA